MKKYGIVVDSSVSLTRQQANNLNVVVAPLTLTHNNKNYEDQITLTHEKVREILNTNGVIHTSQPNIGRIIELIEPMKEEHYDHIFVLSLSSYLSGTFSAFNHAIAESGIQNITVVDTFSLGGVTQQCIQKIRLLEKENADVETILTALADIIEHTTVYVYPQDLRQLKASGRISAGAATLASLLKIKPILRFESKGTKIEKFETARTEAKAFTLILDDMRHQGVNAQDNSVYILEFEADAVASRFEEALESTFPGIQVHRIVLPAAVATHAGIGTIAIQWVRNI